MSLQSQLRVMTWNIHGGRTRDGRLDLLRIVEVINRHEPDVVALQEVDSRHRTASDPAPFAYLREAVGQHGIEAKSIITADGDYGQMVVSKWPFDAMHIHDISVPGREPRRAVEAVIDAPMGHVRLVASHFGLGFAERRIQARRIVEIARSHVLPTILVGDFNDWSWPSRLRDALRQELPGRTHHRTFPAHCPLLRLDRIYCWPRESLGMNFTDRAARCCSDHLPVIADITPHPASETGDYAALTMEPAA